MAESTDGHCSRRVRTWLGQVAEAMRPTKGSPRPCSHGVPLHRTASQFERENATRVSSSAFVRNATGIVAAAAAVAAVETQC